MVGRKEHKISTQVDELLFLVIYPKITFPILMSKLERYSSLSNFQVNMSKTIALNLTLARVTYASLKEAFAFKWSESHINCLGIDLTREPRGLDTQNFLTLIEELRKDLERWHKCHLTWLGRCNAIKQNILPKLLYRITAIPITIPRSGVWEF